MIRRLLVLLTLGLVLGGSGASLADTSTLYEVPIQGSFQLGSSDSVEVPALDAGAAPDPEPWRGARGVVPVPAEADRIHIHVTVSSDATLRGGFRLQACEGSCVAGGPQLARSDGPRSLAVDLAARHVQRLGWEVMPHKGTHAGVNVTGRIAFATHADPLDGAEVRSASASSSPGWADQLAVGLLASSALAVLARAPRAWGPLTAIPQRVEDDELLDHPRRAAIVEAIHERPGIHASELRRRLGMADGTLRHHLAKLEKAGLVRSRKAEGYRCYFPPDHADAVPETALVALRSARARSILSAIVDDPGRSLTGLATRLQEPTSTVSYHLEKLVEAGLVRRHRRAGRLQLRATGLGERACAELGLSGEP